MHLQGEAAMGSLAVELLGEAPKFYAVLAKLIDRAHHFHQGAAETIKFPDSQKVLRSEIGEDGFEGGTFCAGLAGFLLLKNILATGTLHASR
jgi:hypothetical protein